MLADRDIFMLAGRGISVLRIATYGNGVIAQ